LLISDGIEVFSGLEIGIGVESEVNSINRRFKSVGKQSERCKGVDIGKSGFKILVSGAYSN